MGDAILLLQQMPKWRRTFPNDFSTIREEIIQEGEEEREGQLPPHWQLIAGQLPLVEDFTFNLLRTHYSTNEGKQVVCIEWDSLVILKFLDARFGGPQAGFFSGGGQPLATGLTL